MLLSGLPPWPGHTRRKATRTASRSGQPATLPADCPPSPDLRTNGSMVRSDEAAPHGGSACVNYLKACNGEQVVLFDRDGPALRRGPSIRSRGSRALLA